MKLRFFDPNSVTIKKLKSSLKKMIGLQFLDFFPIYLGALVCLFLTHYIQSHLPFMAKEVAEKIGQGDKNIDVMVFVWVSLGIIVFRTSSRLLFFYPARVMERDFRANLLSLFEKTSPLRYSNMNKGQIFQVIYQDVEQIRALVGFALLQIGNVAIALMVLIPKIASFNADLLLALIPMLIAFFLFSIIVGKTRKYHRATMDLQGEVQNFIMETYDGKSTIKNYHAEKSFLKSFSDLSFVELVNFYKAGVGVAFSIPLLPMGIGFSLIWGSYLIFQLDLGASSLVLFSGFVFLFMEPLMFVAWIGIVFVASITSWNRIKEAHELITNESEEESKVRELNYFEDEHHFHFPFWDEKLSLSIPPNSWTIFIGQTGHGKSHLIKSLAEALRLRGENISYVAQDPYLYNDTIEGNIFLGRIPSEEEKNTAVSLLEMMGLDELDTDSSEILSIEVGEHGKKVSGGQAKRICLVRSLLSGANILLWDDPFSSVDLIHEGKITEKLKAHELIRGKTLVLTGHRLSTVRNCDWIIYVEKERGLVEQGASDVLLKANKETYEYFENQFV